MTSRAAEEQRDGTPLQGSKFKITINDLVEQVEAYRNRKIDEDITYLKDTLEGLEGIYSSLFTSLDSGLDGSDFFERDKHFGDNYKPPPERTPFCKFFCAAMNDLMLKVLIVCAFISIVVSMIFEEDHRETAWIEGFAILVAVFIVSGVGSWNDYKKEEQFLKLYAFSKADEKVTATRNGAETDINYNDIKVGDVIRVRSGMYMPVDGIVLRERGQILTDESAMTGESIEQKKASLHNCLMRKEEKLKELEFSKGSLDAHSLPSPVILSGTQVQQGDGELLVLMVGKNTCVGKIMDKLEQQDEVTPLQQKLESIATDIGKLGMVFAALTVVVLFIRFFVQTGQTAGGFDWDNQIGTYLQEWFRFIIIGIAIIVMAVPEGLPLAVMISLAFSVRKMLDEENFVKKLASCEIMGGANSICSDKTGTLTRNEMTVTNVWKGKVSGPIEELAIEIKVNDDQYIAKDYFTENQAEIIFQSLACNTQGTVNDSSATEKAMLKMLAKFQIKTDEIRAKHLGEDFVRFMFNSKRKRMSTIANNISNSKTGYDKRIHIKGAAEIVLASCSKYLDEHGNEKEMDQQVRSQLLEVIEHFGKQALRVICIAYKDLQSGDGGPTHEDDDADGVSKSVEKTDMICLGLLGIRDIIRKEVPDAVATCRKAGITVRMVTGDNKITALAIAKECKIINEGDEMEMAVMEGKEFYDYVGGLICKKCNNASPCECAPADIVEGVKYKDKFEIIWKNLRVLARSRPEDKYLMVTGLKEYGDTVAVTGDGTNDAPAMKKSDVGFAMGKAGTDVAKHAADIVLLDDNFASIVRAVIWGRNIYDNIRRFLQFQLTVNIVALLVAFLGAVILRESPLQAIQMLWVNLIMDSLASLALATEPPRDELLDRPPHGREEYIISRKMIKHLVIMAIWQSAVIFVISLSGSYWIPDNTHIGKVAINPLDSTLLHPGQLYYQNGDDLYKQFKPDYGPSRHFTLVFNIFVWMQIFNLINARKINDELNPFDGILSNKIFLFIFFGIAILQVVIVQFSQDVFQVCRYGLTPLHWAMSIGLGLSVLPVDFLIKFIPDKLFCEIGKKKKNPLSDTGVLNLRRQRSESYQLRQKSFERRGSKRDN